MDKRCTNNNFGVHQVDSDTSTKVYEVIIREDGRHECNCTGFVTKRNKFGGKKALGNPEINCKHVKAFVNAHGCGWDSATGVAQAYPNICPLCDSATEDYTEVPDVIDDDDVEDAIAKMLATRERMMKR